MKSRKTINALFLLVALSAALVSCNKEELTTNDTPQGSLFSITITDGGYAPNSTTEQGKHTAPDTRSTDNGYATTFTAGDQVGLYVVKPDGSYAAQNICLTLTDTGSGSLAWQAPAGTKLWYEGTGAKYFTYYPYQATLAGALDASSTDATKFFADVVSQWTPTPDQSTHALYTASDLMIGSCTNKGKQPDGTFSLSFSMSHAMALMVIETPVTNYTFEDEKGKPIPNYSTSASNIQFYGFTPYSPPLDTYRYLVKPTQSGAADLYGSYTTGDKTIEYALAQNNISAANYVLSKVGGGATQKSHTLKVGDFYFSDGTLESGDAILTEDQKAACLGIVMKVGKDSTDASTYKLKDNTTPLSEIHGYVLALNETKSIIWATIVVGGINATRGSFLFNGYSQTNKIKTASSAYGGVLKDLAPAIYYTTTGYEALYPAPTSSSGWFCPSAGQCQCWLENKDVLLSSIVTAIGKSYEWDKKNYWSTSMSLSISNCVWTLNLSDGTGMTDNFNKNSSLNTRAILAF